MPSRAAAAAAVATATTVLLLAGPSAAAGETDPLGGIDGFAATQLAFARVVLDPAVGEESAAGTYSGTSPLLQHLDGAHWNRSPGRQVEDISVLDRWIGNHLALVQRMVGGATGH